MSTLLRSRLTVLLLLLLTPHAQAQQALAPMVAPGSNDQFGFALASSGNIVAVGAPQCSLGHTSYNAVLYTAYSLNGYVALFSCTSTCIFQSRINGSNVNSCFGQSVALLSNGQFLAVGAPTYNIYAGILYTYDLTNPASPVRLGSYTSGSGGYIGWALAASQMADGSIVVAASAPYLGYPYGYDYVYQGYVELGGAPGGALVLGCMNTTSAASCQSVLYQTGHDVNSGYAITMTSGFPYIGITGSGYEGELPNQLTLLEYSNGAVSQVANVELSWWLYVGGCALALSNGVFLLEAGGTVYAYECSLSPFSCPYTSYTFSVPNGGNRNFAMEGSLLAISTTNNVGMAFFYNCQSWSTCFSDPLTVTPVIVNPTNMTGQNFGAVISFTHGHSTFVVAAPDTDVYVFSWVQIGPFTASYTESATASFTESATASFTESATASLTASATGSATVTSTPTPNPTPTKPVGTYETNNLPIILLTVLVPILCLLLCLVLLCLFVRRRNKKSNANPSRDDMELADASLQETSETGAAINQVDMKTASDLDVKAPLTEPVTGPVTEPMTVIYQLETVESSKDELPQTEAKEVVAAGSQETSKPVDVELSRTDAKQVSVEPEAKTEAIIVNAVPEAKTESAIVNKEPSGALPTKDKLPSTSNASPNFQSFKPPRLPVFGKMRSVTILKPVKSKDSE